MSRPIDQLHASIKCLQETCLHMQVRQETLSSDFIYWHQRRICKDCDKFLDRTSTGVWDIPLTDGCIVEDVGNILNKVGSGGE